VQAFFIYAAFLRLFSKRLLLLITIKNSEWIGTESTVYYLQTTNFKKTAFLKVVFTNDSASKLKAYFCLESTDEVTKGLFKGFFLVEKLLFI
jgi:hypothetical protein